MMPTAPPTPSRATPPPSLFTDVINPFDPYDEEGRVDRPHTPTILREFTHNMKESRERDHHINLGVIKGRGVSAVTNNIDHHDEMGVQLVQSEPLPPSSNPGLDPVES